MQGKMGKLFDVGDAKYAGKSIKTLQKSQASRSDLIRLFGGANNLPSSIMKADKRDREDYDPAVENGRKYQDHRIMNGMYPKGATDKKKAPLSTFPQNICKSILLMYSDLVIDPFSGHNSRMTCCVENNRHYHGTDLCEEFMKYNFIQAEKLRLAHPKIDIEIHHCDSRKLPWEKRSGDFTITSPPYYDVEYYGPEVGQLGWLGGYEEFLEGLRQVMVENYRVLKRGAFSAWFVNDFRRQGKFYSYHTDCIRLMESVGFVTHDLVVVDFGPGIRDIFVNQSIQQQILPKRHEFGLIFRKPEKKPSTPV